MRNRVRRKQVQHDVCMDEDEPAGLTDDAGSMDSCAMEVDGENVVPSASMQLRYAASSDSEDDAYGLDDFDPLNMIVAPPPLPLEYHGRPNALPRKTRSSPPITLVLDLDETLVHCTTTPIPGIHSDINFVVPFNGLDYKVVGNFRPGCHDFLAAVAKEFEVVVFTASQKAYADRLLNILDPDRKWIKYRLFRDSCVFVGGNYLKDLSILGRDLAHVVIVDNAPQAFAYQVLNGVPIESWYDQPNDAELVKIYRFLQDLRNATDVRPVIDQCFRWRERVSHLF